MLDIFDSLLSFSELLHVEVAMIIWEVLALNTTSHDFLIDVFHSKIWHI